MIGSVGMIYKIKWRVKRVVRKNESARTKGTMMS